MKVLMLNTFDEVGGAARAAVRLLGGVRERGVDASLLVQFRTGNAGGIICNSNSLRRWGRRLKMLLGTLPVLVYPNRPEKNFTPALLPDNLEGEVAQIDPDILHLHWLGAGFLRVETLAVLGRPLIWTLHDSWAFTGGCHVPFDCERYRQDCGACPILGSSRERDLSRWTWKRKQKAWRHLNPTLVAPSRWLADCARSSSLFRDHRVEVIPNGLDTGTFRPMDKDQARISLGLPENRRIVLFGAVRATSDPNKGFQLLTPALQALGRGRSNMLAVVFGSSDPGGLPDLGMPSVSLGRIEDDRRLTAIYSASDVFVVPSIQETFCQTASEAMACGIPVVAFGATGLLDIVEHRRTGYLARPYDSEDLARGIAWVLEDGERHAELSLRARQKVEAEFSRERVSERYIALYRELLAGR